MKLINIANLFVLTIAAIAAPVTVYFSVSAYNGYRIESIRNADLKQQQRKLQEYSAQVAEYERFATRVEQFVQNARSAGVVEEAWNKHHIDIKDRIVSFTELDQFVDDAGGGDNYYFLPNKLQIQSPGVGAADNPFRSGRKTPLTDEVIVSLAGDYLVRIK